MKTYSPRWSGLIGALLAAVALAAQAQTASSSRYRVEGNVIPAGAGRSGQGGLRVYHVVGQSEPVAGAASDGFAVEHAWRLPPIVERLFRYALAAGWNLQGAPGVSDRPAGAIFTGAAGAPIKIGNLQYPTTAGSFVQADDSDPILGLQAFWVFSYWGGRGELFATPDAHLPDDGTAWQDLLQPGWNLFSPPYTVTVPTRGTVVVVWRWDPATSSYAVVPPGHELQPLEGYWIYKLSNPS